MAADEQKTETTQTEETKSGKVVFETQEDFDSVIQNRLAKERSKYSDYEQTKAELEKLRQTQKEREEAEMSELQKAQKALEDTQNQVLELEQFRTKWAAHEEELGNQVEKASADLSEEQKELVSAVPLDKRMALINQLKASAKQAPDGAYNGGSIPRSQNANELFEVRRKYGVRSVEYKKALAKYNS